MGVKALTLLSGGKLDVMYEVSSRMVEFAKKRRKEIAGVWEEGDELIRRMHSSRMKMQRRLIKLDGLIAERHAKGISVVMADWDAELERVAADFLFCRYKIEVWIEQFNDLYNAEMEDQ